MALSLLQIIGVEMALLHLQKNMWPAFPTNARNGGARSNHISSFAVLQHKHELSMPWIILTLRETQSTTVDLGGNDVAVRGQI